MANQLTPPLTTPDFHLQRHKNYRHKSHATLWVQPYCVLLLAQIVQGLGSYSTMGS